MTTLARSLLRNPDAADDVVATALLRIHKAAPGFRGERGLKNGLTDEQREAVILRDRLGMTYEAAATAAEVRAGRQRRRVMNERRNLVIAIVVAFVFGVAGGMVGTLATVALVHHHDGGPFFAGERRPGGPHGRGPGRGWRGEPGRPGMERVLHRQLDLTDEQRTKLKQLEDRFPTRRRERAEP